MRLKFFLALAHLYILVQLVVGMSQKKKGQPMEEFTCKAAVTTSQMTEFDEKITKCGPTEQAFTIPG